MTPKLYLILFVILYVNARPVPESKLYFTDYCSYFNYPSEIHQIQTDDGFILTFFRVQAKHTLIREGLPPILLMHGLLDCSDTFIINDEDKALAFVLANRGYDVWLGNNRGNKHSKEHTKYTSNSKSFWDFTFEDMAIYDLPAAFKFISSKTNQLITYIGHSQGTAQMHVHLSMFPSNEESIVRQTMKIYIGLGPVAYVKNMKSEVFQYMLKFKMDKILVDLGIEEFMPGDTWVSSVLGREFCSHFPLICGDLIGSIISADKNLDNYDRYDVLAGHDPAGTSTKNMLYFTQLLKSGNFQRYDYGESMNVRIYGQATAPLLDLGNINIPVHYFAGYQDLLAVPEDVENLVKNLVNSPKIWIKMYDAGHCSFMWGKQMLYYGDLFDIMEGRQ